MSVAHPRFLHQFLQELKEKPKKGLSQNFLIDQNIVHKIVSTLNLQEGESVLEIGAGPGALTELLVARNAQVTVVEKDRTFAKALHRFPAISVYEGDFFDFDLTSLSKGTKVVSNLPYHLTSPILTTLLPQHEHFSIVTLMMQKEVAERLMAVPHSANYGSLTLFRLFYADIISAFTVTANCFYPKPKVDSMVLTFHLKKFPQEVDPEAFFSVTRTAFMQRRKMLRASLKDLFKGKLEQVFETSGIAPTSRPEELSFDDYIALSCYNKIYA